MKREQIEKEINARLEEPDNDWDGIFNSGYSRSFRDGAQWLADRLCHLPLDKLAQELTEYINQREEETKMKPILDACCGGKMFYFDKHDSRVLFQDIRDMETTLCDGRHFEVRPDVQADFTDMPYPNDSFSMVVFDPPHLKCSENQKSISGYQMIKYGALSKGWRDMLYKGFSECFRVLKPGGFLIFKWNETDIKVSEVLKLAPEKPVFGHISGKRSNTHWICFMKGGEK